MKEAKKFSCILMGFAFSPKVKVNVLEALRLSNYMKAKLILFHVGEKTKIKEESIDKIIKESEEIPPSISIKWEEGTPTKTLLTACKTYNVDLLLLGALQRENALNFYIGSIARKLTRKAPCSVLLLINLIEEKNIWEHIVVNALKNKLTVQTIETSFNIANVLSSKKITLVEEISQEKVTPVEDEKSLLEALAEKETLKKKSAIYSKDILEKIPNKIKDKLQIKIQNIFGKRGYSIGHYAKVVRADLLVMSIARNKSLFPLFSFSKDLEYILLELPTNVLILKYKKE